MRIDVIFLALAFLAEVIGTVGGFGSSVFFVPLGNFYFDFYSVLGLTAIFHLSSNLSKIYLFKKGLYWKLILYIGVPSVVFAVFGGLLSREYDEYFLKFLLALFLISLSLIFLLRSDIVVKANRRNSLIGGSLSGFSAGLLGTGGAIRGLTMAAFNLKKSVFVATSACIDLMIDTTRTIVYYRNGYIHKHDLIYAPFLLLIGILGTYLGKRILHHIPQRFFRRLSLVFILVIGVIMLVKLFMGEIA